MSWLLRLICTAAVFTGSMQISNPSSKSYKAAVVEVAVNHNKNLDERTTDYVNFIEDAHDEDVDIIVFPEGTLNEKNEEQIYLDATSIVPCENDSSAGNPIERISCAARENQMYVVINLTMKRNCTADCAVQNYNLYNTNVVFDRNGTIVSTYRQTHLFEESQISTPVLPDVSWFDTDFDVRFGHFIGFDMMFEVPALNLTAINIKNFAFPNMWVSEIPFLTAVQMQQSWSYEHNVNLLGAGANNPTRGSTGSGIYSGKQGTINAIMAGNVESRLFVSEISKTPGASTDPKTVMTQESSKIVLKREKLNLYKHKVIDSDDGSEQIFEVCHQEGNICCHFALKLAPVTEVVKKNTVSYSYVAAAYRGTRKFRKIGHVGVLSCSIIACTNNKDITTCGVLYSSDQMVVNRYEFTQLNITGTFPSNKTMIMPTTLNIDLLPLPTTSYKYYESHEPLLNKNSSIELTTNDSRLLTFGIYGRVFDLDRSSATQLNAVLVLCIVSVLAHLL